MTEPATPVAPASPAPAAAPAAPVVAAAPPATPPARPEWVPETAWDATSGVKLDELGKTFTELATFKTTAEAARAKVPAKAEDYKLEIALPETVKVPEGFALKIDEKDPRIPLVREIAHKHGWSQETLNAVIALDAMAKIADHNTETARVAAENKKLGENAEARQKAVTNWLTGLKERNEITAEEHAAGIAYATDAATVTLFEKLIAKSNGSVPRTGDPASSPKPAEAPMEQRWYGPAQQKAS